MEHIPSHDFPVEQGNSVFLLKYGVNFKKKKKKKLFIADRRTGSLGKIYGGGGVYMTRLMIRSCQVWGMSQIHFPVI